MTYVNKYSDLKYKYKYKYQVLHVWDIYVYLVTYILTVVFNKPGPSCMRYQNIEMPLVCSWLHRKYRFSLALTEGVGGKSLSWRDALN